MKHKSKKNVNNNVIKKICVLFFFLNIVLSQDKIELKQAESLSSLEINNETVTSLKGDIIFKKGSQLLFGDRAIQSSEYNQIELFDNVKVQDGNKIILCDSLSFDTDSDKIQLFPSEDFTTFFVDPYNFDLSTFESSDFNKTPSILNCIFLPTG